MWHPENPERPQFFCCFFGEGLPVGLKHCIRFLGAAFPFKPPAPRKDGPLSWVHPSVGVGSAESLHKKKVWAVTGCRSDTDGGRRGPRLVSRRQPGHTNERNRGRGWSAERRGGRRCSGLSRRSGSELSQCIPPRWKVTWIDSRRGVGRE